MALEPVTAALELGKSILERFVADPTAKSQAKAALDAAAQAGDFQLDMGQLEINKIEAASSSLFVSGWRPGVGWICVTALAVQFLFGPLFTWITQLAGHPVPFPKLETQDLFALLTGLLGFGGMRHRERMNGKA